MPMGKRCTRHAAHRRHVSGGLTFTAVSAGTSYTCGLVGVGEAFCWGYNLDGQLGDGTSGGGNDRLTPTAVTGGLTFTTVSAGRISTCGLLSDGSAYCWGNNIAGQLGDGSTTSSSVPVLVMSP